MGSLISGIAGLVGRKKRERRQLALANQGFDAAREGELGTEFAPTGGAANSLLANILGVGGDPEAGRTAIDNFLSTPGFEFIRDRALGGVTSAFSAGGKLNSGAAARALQDRAGNIAATQLPNFLGQLAQLAQRGAGAASTIANAGTSASSNALGVRQDAQQNTGSSIGRIIGAVNPFGLFG